LLLLTRDLRVALVALVAIPISLLTALVVVDLSGQSINTMTLGGLAVALGVVIDDAVIGIENIVRRLRERTDGSVRATIVHASVEVRAPVVYATLLLVLTMVPVMTLTGLQGAFFAPLAFSFVLAILASLLCAITVTPTLAFELLARAEPPREPRFMLALKSIHQKYLLHLCRHPRMAVAAALLLGLTSIAALAAFGGELLPSFRERHYVLQVNGPSGASIAWMRTMGKRISDDLLGIEGVATVEQQIGRAEASEDTFPPNRSEFHVELGPMNGAEEDQVLNRIRTVLANYPSIGSEALTFLGDRIGESLSGETAAIVVGVYGNDLDQLDNTAAQIAAVIATVPGAVDVQVKSPPGAPSVLVQLDPDRMRARDVLARNAYDVIEAGFQGQTVAQMIDGDRIIDVAVTMPWRYPDDPEALGAMTVRSESGALVPLAAIAAIDLVDSRGLISHEGARRRQIVTANAAGSDVAGLTAAIQSAVATRVSLPAGVYLDYSGAAQGQAEATNQLLRNAAVAICGIVVLLILAFGGGRPAALILAGAPSALAGGVIAVALTGGVLSLGALVGFVTLFGVAARNAILLVAHADHLAADDGAEWGLETVMRAAEERLTPILATALVTAIGMLPLAIATGEAGREVQGPMATVILGGLVSSTIFSLLLLPPLMLAYRHRSGTAGLTAGLEDGIDAHTAG
jgi:Cu/Ag efflux pump CusA